MIEIKIVGDMVRVFVPQNMQAQAPYLLQKLWRKEFVGQTYCLFKMTEAIHAVVEKAKLNRFILVCL